MIDEYTEKNIEETLAAVSGWGAVQLQRFLIFEREHKNRTGVIDGINDMLVEVVVPEQGYYRGFWYDEGGSYIERDSPRLQQAIEQTELSLKD